jgi:hypothetical protein
MRQLALSRREMIVAGVVWNAPIDVESFGTRNHTKLRGWIRRGGAFHILSRRQIVQINDCNSAGTNIREFATNSVHIADVDERAVAL